MGLDMYLKGRRYVSRWSGEGDAERSAKIAEQFPELTAFGSDEPVVNEVSAELGYWRKANAVHRWFVDKVQAGVDDCGSYPVTRERLQELRDTCERVAKFKHLAEGQLPTAEGFFFGNTEYGEYYYDDVQRTIEIVDRCLALPTQWEFEYHASW